MQRTFPTAEMGGERQSLAGQILLTCWRDPIFRWSSKLSFGMNLTLSDFLIKNGIDPGTTLALRHSPTERLLAEVFTKLIEREHNVFNIYQSVQTPKVEKQMAAAKHVAAFYALPKERAVFIGLYEQRGDRTITKAELEVMPSYRALVARGLGESPEEARKTMLLFDLQEIQVFAGYQGRIVVQWPKPPVQWSRWADRDFPITAIHEENMLHERIGAWDQISLTCAVIKLCPQSWINTLSGIAASTSFSTAPCGRGMSVPPTGWRTSGNAGHATRRLAETPVS